ncbi:MAG: HNH endonuclease [Bryobacteraceae bacterium]
MPDAILYRNRAAVFERIDLGDQQRRQGFLAFAPACLKSSKPHFPPLWNKAKNALARMSHDKCAYCEGGINSTRTQQVDHFQPKSLFPSLAYDWGNYFLSCGGCNGAKSDKWHAVEYLRPDAHPSAKLQFHIDGTVTARHSGGPAEATIGDFGLKRDPLVRRRRMFLKQMQGRLKDYIELCKENKKLGIRFARNELVRLNAPDNPYSTALTQCFQREWKAVIRLKF